MKQPGTLATTVLHAWHAEHGAKLVEFGGYEMPVQYASGIIQEHLATRRASGAFDVSHMGRYRVRGRGAGEFLGQVLTSRVSALVPGQAQYGFMATPGGGAVDDAYLYMLAGDDYLLVVNAGNRAKDWEWLTKHLSAGASMEDESDRFGMISLQGPESEHIMAKLAGARNLPPNKRNQLCRCQIASHEVIVARTGYTGEPVCFELFPDTAFTVELWQMLIDEGATPVGLDARDSLRLEAGLPLYGHELGVDRNGTEIPVFVNPLAGFAVRAPGGGDYIGRAAIEAQREEYERIRRGELEGWSPKILTHVIQPVAVFDGRRPLRAGQRVNSEGREVGYITSGTSVPYARFYSSDLTELPSREHGLRPIGLALLDSHIRFRSDRPTPLTVVDDRGKESAAELVERNLWPVAPFGRAYTGFEAWQAPPRVEPETLAGKAGALKESARDNHRWRRTRCINLIPSEQCTSAFVDSLCVSDPAGRYNEHKPLRALGPNADDVRYYKGTGYIMDRELELIEALTSFFECARAEPRVISGQMANDTVFDALVQFRNRHRRGREPRRLQRVLVHDLNRGGHLSAQFMGALKNYVAIDPATERPAVEHFVYREDNPHAVDPQATCEVIERTRPDLIVFGRSVIIHREPVRPIARFVHELYGSDNPSRPLIMFDAAHVLGLLGEAYQKPLAEGADVITGSTHKTFFGPQRGVILSDIAPGHAFEPFWRQVGSRAFPGHVSNHHLGTLLGMLGATYEMLAFKDVYPARVIGNAKAFARALAARGLVLEGDPAIDFTETHQVLLRGARGQGERLASSLEAHGVITNPQAYHDDPSFAAASGVRMGTQEMTRFGMHDGGFQELAELVASIIARESTDPDPALLERVAALRARHLEMSYCL